MKRIEITEEMYIKAPKITEMLQRIIGGREKTINILRFSEDPTIVAFLDVYDRIPTGDQLCIPLEAVMLKAQVNAATFIGAVTFIAKQMLGHESQLELLVNHPEVVRKTIKFATELPGASADRKMLHDAALFIPKTPPMSVNVQQNNVEKVAVAAKGPSAASPVPQAELPTSTPLALAAPKQDPLEAFTAAFPTIDKKLEQWADKRRALVEAARKQREQAMTVPFAPTESEVLDAEYSEEEVC
jgi:hypothetical protein